MKRYKEMSPDKRDAMILEAVAANVSFEGHNVSAQRFLDEAVQIRKRHVGATVVEQSDAQKLSKV